MIGNARSQVATDDEMNSFLVMVFEKAQDPQASCWEAVQQLSLTPPFDPEAFPQPFTLFGWGEDKRLTWPDPNAGINYDREHRLKASRDQLAELQKLRDDFDERVYNLESLEPEHTRPLFEAHDLDAAVQRMGIEPPDDKRPWTVAVRYTQQEVILVWHDWQQVWPVEANSEQVELLRTRFTDEDCDSDVLAEYAISIGLVPPFNSDMGWSISFDIRDDGVIVGYCWSSPYDYTLRIG